MGTSACDRGFNRSMQHTENCVSREGVADEAEPEDLLNGEPAGSHVGTLAEGRVA